MQTNYTEHFKKRSNRELLQITQHPTEYNPAAVTAAEQELASRNIAEVELERLTNSLHEKRADDISPMLEMLSVTGEKMVQLLVYLWKQLNPFRADLPRAERAIKAIILYLLYSLVEEVMYSWPMNYSFIITVYHDVLNPFESAYYIGWAVFAMFSFTLITPLFLLRKRLGWILVVMFYIYTAVTNISQCISYYRYSFIENAEAYFVYGEPSYAPIFWGIFWAVFHLLIVVTLGYKGVRERFNISYHAMIWTVSLTLLGILSFIIVTYYLASIGGIS